MDSVGARIQDFSFDDQVVVLARLATAATGRFAVGDLDELFDRFGLPRPAKTSNVTRSLEGKGLLSRARGSGRTNWQLTPIGRARSAQLASDIDLAALEAETALVGSVKLASTEHPVVPPSLAPPELIRPLHSFLEDHPFELNVFAMTRFPDGDLDPIAAAVEASRDICGTHGLKLHLASDRQIVDDLWPNVAAHLWGSRYAVAFYEERTGDGLNYNLNIEVGSALVLGRRLAILKDGPVENLPSDLVGRIYKEVDFSSPATITDQLHRWIRDDLGLGACTGCPTN